MSQTVPVTVIGSRFRIEPWTQILTDGGITVVLPDQVVTVFPALCLGTVMERPPDFGVWWVRKVPLEDSLTAAHVSIGRASGEEISAAFHGAIHGLRVIGKAGKVTSSPRETAAALRELLATAQVPAA